MKKRLVFFNYFHHGVIHAAREFIKDIMKKTNNESAFFFHKLSPCILKDINITEGKEETIEPNNDVLYYEDDKNIYVNTWYHLHFGHAKYQCTIEALYYNFTFIYQSLGIKLEEISYYIPSIDYTKYDIEKIDEFFKNTKYEKFIYISNGMVSSSQADYLNLDPQISMLSKIHKDYLFILTNDSICGGDNIIQSKDIIGTNGKGDLNENSYISTKCDIIVGRESGPYFFTYVKDNVETDKPQVIVPMCYIKPFIDPKYYNVNKRMIHTTHSQNLMKIINNAIL
jgi:hypothetical protein